MQLLAGLTYPSTPTIPMLTNSHSSSSEFWPIWNDCRCMFASPWPKPQVIVLYHSSGTYIKYVEPLESNYWPHISLNTHYTHAHYPFCFIWILTNMRQLQVHVGITMAQAPGYGGVSFIWVLYKVCSITGKPVCSATGKQLLAGLTYPSTPTIPMLTNSHSSSSEFWPIWNDCRCMFASPWPKPQVMVLYHSSGSYIKYVQSLESSWWPHISLNTHYTHAH